MQNHGFGETVAPLGTALTADHIAILCKSNRNITFCFDGDNAGQKAAVRACDIVLPFLRDNSDVRFAFVTGGKDPDEVLKSGGESAMRKIIDSATPLIDFLWQTINKNYIVSTPGGRSQAEKFLKSQIEKITDIDFRREIENEYDTRKFNEWHKWRKNKDNAPQIELPAIDEMTKKTLVYIVNTYPELVERYGEFLSGLNIDFDSEIITDAKLDLKSSEKYIVSLKLNRYIDKLKNDRTALIQMALAGDSSAKDQIIKIDSDIASANEKLENLMNME
jgi:DNA primase